MKTLGAYHRTYYNGVAFKKAFEEFRRFFPTSPYVIISDNGDDFSEYVNEHTFFIKSNIRLWGTGPNAQYGDNFEQWENFYNMIKKSCELCNTDYIISMEDDVLIKNKFEIDFDFDHCGPCYLAKLPDHTVSFIEKKLNKTLLNTHYGLSGGAMFNRKKFIDNFDKIIYNLKKYHLDYSNNLKEIITLVGDGNFTTNLNLIGLDYVCNPWLGKEIIHPFKKYYK